jgi:DNA-binding transcriptional MerR regulator
MSQRLFTKSDIAKLAAERGAALTPAAVALAARQGRLPVATVTAGGVRLFSEHDVEVILAYLRSVNGR